MLTGYSLSRTEAVRNGRYSLICGAFEPRERKEQLS